MFERIESFVELTLSLCSALAKPVDGQIGKAEWRKFVGTTACLPGGGDCNPGQVFFLPSGHTFTDIQETYISIPQVRIKYNQ